MMNVNRTEGAGPTRKEERMDRAESLAIGAAARFPPAAEAAADAMKPCKRAALSLWVLSHNFGRLAMDRRL